MKKLITLITIITCIQCSFGQTQRMVLVEEFTQAAAPPSGFQNPAFDALLQANTTKVIPIKYQTSWPAFDPMHNHNPADANNRTSYYNVTGIPCGFVDGAIIINDCSYYTGAPACLNQSEIDAAYAITSPLQLSLSHTVSADGDSIYITFIINATGSASGNLKARVAVTEEHIHFATSPGGNGETDFYNVMKKMLPDGNGTALPASINVGYSDTITLSWELSNIYDMNQVGVVAWVQNDASKQVLQATYSTPQPYPTFAFISSYTNSSITCNGSLTPVLTMHNGGTNTITSAVISHSIDNIPNGSFPWSGSLSAGSDVNFNAPPETVSGSHFYSAWISEINGNVVNTQVVQRRVLMHGFGTAASTPVTEGFINVTFPPVNWVLSNPDDDLTWLRSTYGGFQQSTNSAKFPFFNVPGGTIDELYVENFDLSNTSQTQATLQFAIAKANYQDASYVDRLLVLGSADCGQAWDTLYDKSDLTGLSTVVNFNSWSPSQASHWRNESADISSLLGNSNVLLKFKTISGFGNNMYIDDINVHYGAPIGIDEEEALKNVSVFPNPAKNILNINNITGAAVQIKINVYDMTGRIISSHLTNQKNYQLNIESLDAGMYLCGIDSGDKKRTVLFSKTK